MSTPVHPTSARRPGPVLTPVRRGQDRSRAASPSGTPAERAMRAVQSSAGNRAATAMVQRARNAPRGRAPENANPPGGSRSYRDRIAAILDRLKKNFEFIDTFVKGVQVPANAGFSQHAAATVNEGLKHSAADSGAGAVSESLVAETVGAALGGIEAAKARKDAKKHQSGAAFHGAHKKYTSKTAEAVVSASSAGNYALGVAKELTKAEKAAHAMEATEVSGVGSSVVGAVKGARAARRFGLTARKYRALEKIERPDRTEEGALTRLNQARENAEWSAAEAYVALDAHWDHDGADRLDRVSDAIDAAWSAMGDARDAARDVQRAEDVNTMNTVLTYALAKQRNKMGKQALTAVGESAKAAGGVVTAIAATAGGAGLASNPVGWGLAAGAAGLIFGVAAYKGTRAGMKRYEGARHPDRWAAQGGTAAEPASREDALKEALKFWKKVANGERQAMARRIYALAAGPDVSGSGNTSAEMRESARALLVALKAGPANQRLTPEAWANSLNDPAKTAAWVKEIAEQLSSA
ncbi:hypothetical protein SAMN05216223_12248 [Actinacidiphila yanglinensis]|uniref:Uncharacterized protein n=1 Tax=Actinacidiphila yanglinensis TaxID=310779 RepID=A0A1H6DZ75_9ACTN|nr:hypothetical protein [Actinacidiphila yanglinensis]SEG90657.1 hypothetical protein SAMN05216223_12248 [Actinacidiphila yanglinensis]